MVPPSYRTIGLHYIENTTFKNEREYVPHFSIQFPGMKLATQAYFYAHTSFRQHFFFSSDVYFSFIFLLIA